MKKKKIKNLLNSLTKKMKDLSLGILIVSMTVVVGLSILLGCIGFVFSIIDLNLKDISICLFIIIVGTFSLKCFYERFEM